jgi:hypothetical protein
MEIHGASALSRRPSDLEARSSSDLLRKHLQRARPGRLAIGTSAPPADLPIAGLLLRYRGQRLLESPSRVHAASNSDDFQRIPRARAGQKFERGAQ